MERTEFIAEAKKLGMEDSVIQRRLELYDGYESEGTPIPYECFLGPFINPSDVNDFLAGPPTPALSAF